MLTVTEDMLLLLLHKDGGRFLSGDEHMLQHALVGCVLMDLALTNRIDTDLEHLEVIDPTPTGKSFLDRALKKIASNKEPKDIGEWLVTLSSESGTLTRDEVVTGLVEHGFLVHKEKKFLGFRFLRYLPGENPAEPDLKKRIADVLFSENNIPDPRDISLICIADACDILQTLFKKKRIREITARLQQLRKMDLVGSGMVAQLALWKLEHTVLSPWQ